MGGSVSTGADNDELTSNLLAADYIRSVSVERVFRAIDRAEYILPEQRAAAYRDQAWRNNHLHLSAPCIYSEVMEGLCIEPGLSFLNLGSGTGYLSTMVGLILGTKGINHGVELYEDVIHYANKKLDDFKRYSGAVDEFDFCEPKFMQGNCLCLTSDRQYDRIYVGACCPESFFPFIKNLLKVNGILVLPLADQLIQVKRISEFNSEVTRLLPVSFANLVIPEKGSKENLDLFCMDPQPLQNLCRSQIRNILRQNINNEYPDLKRDFNKAPSQKRCKKAYLGELSELECGSVPVTRIFHVINNSDFYLSDSDSDMDCSSQSDESTHYVEEVELVSPNEQEANDLQELQEVDDNADNASHSRNSLSDSEHQPRQCDNDTSSRHCNHSESDDSDDEVVLCDHQEDDDDENKIIDMNERRIVSSPFTPYMRDKIKELPLPPILKDFLNFYRP